MAGNTYYPIGIWPAKGMYTKLIGVKVTTGLVVMGCLVSDCGVSGHSQTRRPTRTVYLIDAGRTGWGKVRRPDASADSTRVLTDLPHQ